MLYTQGRLNISNMSSGITIYTNLGHISEVCNHVVQKFMIREKFSNTFKEIISPPILHSLIN